MTDANTATNTATRARNIIERLKMFNRKERDHLMQIDDNSEQTLSQE